MNDGVWREECPKTAALALAYLSARRRQPAGPLLLNVVRNKDGAAVDFGSPSEWGPGVAWSVIRGEFWVDALQVDAHFVDLDASDELPLKITRSVSHPALLQSDIPPIPFLPTSLFPLNGSTAASLSVHVPSPSDSWPVNPHPSPPTLLMRSRTDPLSSPSSSSKVAAALLSPRANKRSCKVFPGMTQADIQFVESLDVGVVGEKGQRSSMEDYYICVPDFDKVVREKIELLQNGEVLSPSRELSATTPTTTTTQENGGCFQCGSQCLPGMAYFAVFDGHGGQGCAEYCSQSIHKDIAIRVASTLTTLPNDDLMCDAILTGFSDAERVWLALALNREAGIEKSGSTAAIVLLHGERLYVAHCGDTRVVLSRKGTAIELTKDHTCENAAEVERVEREGGHIMHGLVNGDIEITRSIGDYEQSGGKIPGLTAVPEISKFVLTPEDEFIIIACDGLWDVMNSEQAVGYARISLREDNDIQKACADLVQKALKGSDDNVTALMVGFTKPGSGSSGPFIVDRVCPSFNKKTFQCDRCFHQYEGRNKLEQCPYCAGRKLCGQIECKNCFVNSFASFEDKTKIQCWIDGKNEEREALLVSLTSPEKYWFQCNVCSHRFEASIKDVTSFAVWCPYCSGLSRCSDPSCTHCLGRVQRQAEQPRKAYVPPHLRRLLAKKEAEDIAKAVLDSLLESAVQQGDEPLVIVHLEEEEVRSTEEESAAATITTTDARAVTATVATIEEEESTTITATIVEARAATAVGTAEVTAVSAKVSATVMRRAEVAVAEVAEAKSDTQ